MKKSVLRVTKIPIINFSVKDMDALANIFLSLFNHIHMGQASLGPSCEDAFGYYIQHVKTVLIIWKNKKWKFVY